MPEIESCLSNPDFTHGFTIQADKNYMLVAMVTHLMTQPSQDFFGVEIDTCANTSVMSNQQ